MSLVTKITYILMIALHNTDFLLSPFTCLNSPEGRKGHPYTMDAVIEQQIATKDTSNTSIVVTDKSVRKMIAIIEV